MKKIILMLLVLGASINLFAQDLRKINIDDYKLDAKITSNLMNETKNMYLHIYQDAVSHNKNSCLYRHHIATVLEKQRWYPAEIPYEESDPDDLTMDFIAAMTDDYCVDYHALLFPKSTHRISYVGYFDEGQ